MKKIVSLLLCVALLCSMAVVVAHADGDAQVQVANVTALPGAAIALDINLANNPGFAALKITIDDSDGLGVFDADLIEAETTAVEDKTPKSMTLQSDNLVNGVLLWFGSADVTATTLGTLTFTVPADAEPGTYEFVISTGEGAEQAINAADALLDISGSSFTITVVDKIIDGMNVAIDAGTAIGVHVQTTDPDNTSITAVDVVGMEFTTVTDYVEDEENGGYIYYLNVNPWNMDVDYTVDFTENFKYKEVEKDVFDYDYLNLDLLPATAKTVGILSYCEKVKGTSDELDQLVADMLEFGRQAQIYKGVETPTFDLPAGLAATEAAWENGDGDPCTFGDFCSENYPQDLTGKNNTAKKKFVFDYATINFGSKFVATFTFANGTTATASNQARVKVNGETYSLDGWNLDYAFSPAEYAGVEFDLYAAANTTATNFAWINNYGPAYYAAYVNDTDPEGGATLLALLESFYNYGVSVETYAASIAE